MVIASNVCIGPNNQLVTLTSTVTSMPRIPQVIQLQELKNWEITFRCVSVKENEVMVCLYLC